MKHNGDGRSDVTMPAQLRSTVAMGVDDVITPIATDE
jgi:hypothetical protein